MVWWHETLLIQLLFIAMLMRKPDNSVIIPDLQLSLFLSSYEYFIASLPEGRPITPLLYELSGKTTWHYLIMKTGMESYTRRA